MHFTGTAIYLFHILARDYLTDVNITLDGEFATRVTLTWTAATFEYNALVFSQIDMPDGEHTVGMSAFGPQDSTILFDYAIYM